MIYIYIYIYTDDHCKQLRTVPRLLLSRTLYMGPGMRTARASHAHSIDAVKALHVQSSVEIPNTTNHPFPFSPKPWI